MFSCGAGDRAGVGRTGSLLDTILHFFDYKTRIRIKT